ncbi:MAG: hypothetical protein LQ350_008004 [Teloschistes chrysophthalmus]|nr:MAG: hypothetical protein LQ350_008004 [Niorma chrysophthalma]
MIEEGKPMDVDDEDIEIDANDDIDGLDDDFRFPKDLEAPRSDDPLDSGEPAAIEVEPTSSSDVSPAATSLLPDSSASSSMDKSPEPSTWKTVRQLVAFREQAAAIADD